MDCIFCKIVDQSIPAEIVHEDEQTVAFLDITPRAPGHTMVVPKVHSSTLRDLPEAEVEPLFAAVKSVAAKVQDAVRADGLTIGINQGKVSGQAVPHLHVHIIPRFTGDRGGSIHAIVDNSSKESVGTIAERIRTQS